MSEQLPVIVDRVAYAKEDSPWKIIRTNKGVCKGPVDWTPAEGERLKLYGKWERSKFNGQPEFAFQSAMADIPTDARALLAYACELTPGLGPKRAEEIWGRYGDAWRAASKELADMVGISKTTRSAWLDTLERLGLEEEKSQTIAYCLSKGMTPAQGVKAWEFWKTGAIGVIQADCYALTALPGIGFVTVDRHIAPGFDIQPNDPRRHDAAALFCVQQICDEGGHTVVQIDGLDEEFRKVLGLLGQTAIAPVLARVIASGRLVMVASGMVATERASRHESEVFKFLEGGK